MPDFDIPVTQEEYNVAGSKFISGTTGAKKGDVFYRNIETGTLDWDTPGTSMKLPTTVIEGPDKGHEEKLSFGVKPDSIWKGKDIYKAITGENMPVNAKTKKMYIPDRKLDGKECVGMWQMVENKTDTAATMPIYPKLVSIFPKGYKAEGGIGI
jgi:hypothetical protein